jgi:hypothetical protein
LCTREAKLRASCSMPRESGGSSTDYLGSASEEERTFPLAATVNVCHEETHALHKFREE